MYIFVQLYFFKNVILKTIGNEWGLDTEFSSSGLAPFSSKILQIFAWPPTAAIWSAVSSNDLVFA